MPDVAWMAWTWETGIFFIAIAVILIAMTTLQTAVPSVERVGVLRIPTTRGDRLFITLLGSAFICLAWIGLVGPDTMWWGFGLCFLYAVAVFRWV